MKIALTHDEAIGFFCAVALIWYISPLLDTSKAWDFLYLWDDSSNFHENEMIQQPVSIETLYKMFTMIKINVYEPLGWLLKAIMWQFIGLDPLVIRIVTVVLHIAATCVMIPLSVTLMEIVNKLSPRKSMKTNESSSARDQQKRYVYGCCISALLFAIHPINVEIVGWPSAQPYALAALFTNLAIYVYIWDLRDKLMQVNISDMYVETDGEVRDTAIATHLLAGNLRKSDLLVAGTDCCIIPVVLVLCQHYSLSITNAWLCLTFVGLYLCSILSKSACILQPAGFFLLDAFVYLQLHLHVLRFNRQFVCTYIWRKLPIIFIMMGFIGVTIASNHAGARRDADLLSLTLRERIVKMLITPMWIVRHILWPVGLRLHYQLREHEIELVGNPECLLSVVGLVLALIWSIHQCACITRRSYHLLALLYFIVMLLPTTGLVQHGMVAMCANRYAYFASVVLIPYGGYWFAERIFDWEQLAKRTVNEADIILDSSSNYIKSNKTSPAGGKDQELPIIFPRRWSAAHTLWLVLIFLTSSLLCVSTQLMEHYRNEENLFAYSLRVDPTDWRILDDQATFLFNNASCTRFDPNCRLILELSAIFAPQTSLKAKLQRLKVLMILGDQTRACEEYLKLREHHSYSCHVLNNAAMCLIIKGDLQAARKHFVMAVEETPGYEAEHPRAVRNLKLFDEWLAHIQTLDSSQPRPKFEGNIMW